MITTMIMIAHSEQLIIQQVMLLIHNHERVIISSTLQTVLLGLPSISLCTRFSYRWTFWYYNYILCRFGLVSYSFLKQDNPGMSPRIKQSEAERSGVLVTIQPTDCLNKRDASLCPLLLWRAVWCVM